MEAPCSFATAAERVARAACGLMGWSPETFWAATPAELTTAMLGYAGIFETSTASPLRRDDLTKLMAEFPDA